MKNIQIKYIKQPKENMNVNKISITNLKLVQQISNACIGKSNQN